MNMVGQRKKIMKLHDRDIFKAELSALQQMPNQIDQSTKAAKDQDGVPAAAIQTLPGALSLHNDLTQKLLKFLREVIDKV
jgi:hypothetical protein